MVPPSEMLPESAKPDSGKTPRNPPEVRMSEITKIAASPMSLAFRAGAAAVAGGRRPRSRLAPESSGLDEAGYRAWPRAPATAGGARTGSRDVAALYFVKAAFRPVDRQDDLGLRRRGGEIRHGIPDSLRQIGRGEHRVRRPVEEIRRLQSDSLFMPSPGTDR